MANPVIEKRNLLFVFAQPNPAELLVSAAISGEVSISADDGFGNPVNVLLQPSDPQAGGRIYNLLDFAPIAGWRVSSTLMRAVTNGWMAVHASTPAPGPAPIVVSTDCCDGKLEAPINAQEGDILSFIGGAWVRVAAGAVGEVLTANGLLTAPAWLPAGVGPSLITLSSGKSTNQPGLIAAGSFQLTSAEYESASFVTVGALSDIGLLGSITLHNLTDDTATAVHSYNSTVPAQQSTVMTLAAGTKLYEVRLELLNGLTVNDRLICSWAGLRLVAA